MGGGLWAHKRLVLLPILLWAGSLVGNGGEGQLVVLYDVDPILVLVFLHVEHFSELFQLVELTEGFQNYQHGNEAKEEVTCDPNLIELSELLIVAFSRDVVP